MVLVIGKDKWNTIVPKLSMYRRHESILLIRSFVRQNPLLQFAGDPAEDLHSTSPGE